MPLNLKNLFNRDLVVEASGGLKIPREIRFHGETAIDIKAAEGEAGTPPRFTMDAYTGGELLIDPFPYPVVVDVAGMEVRKTNLPVFREHKQSQPVGHTDAIDKSSGRNVTAAGVISFDNEHTQEIIASGDLGFPWVPSIGARLLEAKFIPAGETLEANGRTFEGPILFAKRSRLREISFVTFGGDEDSTAKIAATAAAETSGENTMKKTFSEYLKAMGIDQETMSDSLKKTLEAAFKTADDIQDGNVTPPALPGDNINAAGGDGLGLDDYRKAIKKINAEEAARVAQIDTICAEYGNPQIEIEVDGKKTKVDLKSHALLSDWPIDKITLEAMRQRRPQGPAIHSNDTSANDAETIEASLLMAHGTTEKRCGEWFGEEVMNAAVDRRYRSLTLHAVMDRNIAAAGKSFSGSRKTNEFIRAAFEADATLRASGGFSTLAVSQVLENVANKTLIASFETIETVWQFICAIRNFTDFKINTRYRLDSSGSFKKVGPTGELKHVGLEDAKYENQLDTFGSMIALNRQQIINDDLDAFLQIPKFLGQMSATRIEEAVLVLLLSNPASFFHADNNNLLTGGGSVLGVAGLTTAVRTFRDQVDGNGKSIGVSPQVLLVGTLLGETANDLWVEKDRAATGSTDALVFKRNPHKGLFRPYVSPYLSNTSLTDQDGAAISGQSDTQWFLFANPAIRAAIAIAFLNGQQNPTIESAETNFNTLGIQTRAYHDFGVAMEETQVGLKSNGA